MTTWIVIGGQWGDEGKGKAVDWLANRVRPDVGVRFNGGPNAGHSVKNERGEFVLHQVPTNILSSGLAVLANGVVIDPAALLEEVEQLRNCGVAVEGIRISDRAHLILPWHKERDRHEEESRGQNRIGTTGRGIGPAYADKAARSGIRVVDLFVSEEVLRAQLRKLFWREQLRRHGLIGHLKWLMSRLPFLTDLFERPVGEALETLTVFRNRLGVQVVHSEKLLTEANEEGKTILLEGAQGTLLDIDWGTYPHVTSSSATRLGASIGTGLAPSSDEVVLGVFKAYLTRVGEGVFPTELPVAEAERLRQIGNEYGATTGRPRRIGWFDAPLARHAQLLNQFDQLVLTKCDVLDKAEEIQVCTSYRLNGEEIYYPPTTEAELARCEPVYQTLPGWRTSTKHVTSFDQSPREFQGYARFLEELLGVPISLISVGPGREETIEVIPLSL